MSGISANSNRHGMAWHGSRWQPAQCMLPHPKLTAAAARGAILSAMKPARTAPFSTCEHAETAVTQRQACMRAATSSHSEELHVSHRPLHTV